MYVPSYRFDLRCFSFSLSFIFWAKNVCRKFTINIPGGGVQKTVRLNFWKTSSQKCYIWAQITGEPLTYRKPKVPANSDVKAGLCLFSNFTVDIWILYKMLSKQKLIIVKISHSKDMGLMVIAYMVNHN